MLKIENLYKSFPGSTNYALEKINLKLNKEDFCVLIGTNGSGKSTLIKTILGEYNPDLGQIVKEKDLVITSVAQDIEKGTISEMNLLENIVISKLRHKKASFRFYNKYAEEVKEIVAELNIGLEHLIDKPLKFLSGGQRQMVATLMAFITNPDILLLDEHTSALDPKMQKLLMELTDKQVKEKKTACLMITHKLDDALLYGNRLIMMHKGQIVVDLNKQKKESLSLESLLGLFHKYEDLTLRGHHVS